MYFDRDEYEFSRRWDAKRKVSRGNSDWFIRVEQVRGAGFVKRFVLHARCESVFAAWREERK